MPIADVEALLISWFTTLNVQAVTWLPSDLVDAVPIVQVARIGGGSDDDLAAFDFPTVSLDSYAVGRQAAFDLAASVDDAIRTALPGTSHIVTAGTAVVTKTQTISGPSWRPYDDITLRRFGATYRILIRTQ